jgi:hypothetical protein
MLLEYWIRVVRTPKKGGTLCEIFRNALLHGDLYSLPMSLISCCYFISVSEDSSVTFHSLRVLCPALWKCVNNRTTSICILNTNFKLCGAISVLSVFQLSSQLACKATYNSHKCAEQTTEELYFPYFLEISSGQILTFMN